MVPFPDDAMPLINGLLSKVPDFDPEETAEWLESLDGVIDDRGGPRARYLLLNLLRHARERNIQVPAELTTPYVNTIGVEDEPYFPGDETIERAYRRWIRWNAAVMVHRAQRPGVGVGGHLSSYASAATLYEVGQNHFFRGKDHPGGSDHVYFQGHSAPGFYARAFVEGRLTPKQMDGFRQELSNPGGGLPSYPHPRLLPDFWEFPTVSMGLGPMNAIHQAMTDRYLHHHGIKDTSQQHTWAFLGDGEMDEPESRGLLQVAATQGLDNLTFVINCNLQRLDGPVRGNGKIIQELEAFFKGAGWNVIKVIWGREWDPLLQADKDRALVNLMNNTLDGDYQTFRAESGAYIREHFFGRDPRTRKLVENMSDDDIWALRRGGHDYRKVYAAYTQAQAHTGQPTVVLAQTIKGWGLGASFAGRNATHQMKKLAVDDLKELRTFLRIPLTDARLEEDPYLPPYYRPDSSTDEIQYMLRRRSELGGYVPERRSKYTQLQLPHDKAYDVLKRGSGKQEVATTMALVRLFKDLMKDKSVGPRLVPIIPDEARTFGLDSIFPTAKIYNPAGQQYTPVDHAMMLSYREDPQGQIMHMGINEAGSLSAFTATGTSYATHGEPLIPFYIFYSMFGFQRTADSIWAAADQMTRGFLIGATAGRTTLTGEGLQHADGHSPLLAMTNPAVIHYDPAYGYEIAYIVRDALKRMYGENDPRDPNVMYYLTVYNEPIHQPAEPANVDVEGILRGIYQLRVSDQQGPKAQILASGVSVPWALEAADVLASDWGVSADVWSVTSWNELRRDGVNKEEYAFLHPNEDSPVPYVTQKLDGAEGPFVGVSDYAHGVPDQIRQFIPGDYATLGADSFGFSDTRAAARRHFKIDTHSIVVRVLEQLVRHSRVHPDVPGEAIERYRLFDVNAGTTGNAGGEA